MPFTNSEELNTEFRQIYEEAFPADERRGWQQLIDTLENPLFNLIGIYHLKKFIGFFVVWNLNRFSFIEHFAICNTDRGKGFGTQAIQQILSRILTPVILEVEEPFTESAQNRIKFYERLNFSISEDVYYQPPYSTEKNKVKMLLMSYPEQIKSSDFENFKAQIHHFVYDYNE